MFSYLFLNRNKITNIEKLLNLRWRRNISMLVIYRYS